MFISPLQRHFCIRSRDQLFLISRCILGVCTLLFLHPSFITSALQFNWPQAKRERNLKTMTFASLSPSSLFTTLSWLASAWPEGRQKWKRRRKERFSIIVLCCKKYPHYIYLCWYFLWMLRLVPFHGVPIMPCLVSKQHEHHILLCVFVDLSQPGLWREEPKPLDH